tara:strand:- start:1198 stop:1458 length:261 start_codon:yes stop_codon:yes gene_type:complete
MIDRELEKRQNRLDELESRIIRDLEHRTELLYSQIMVLRKGSEEREKLELEYKKDSNELRMRSNEIRELRTEIETLKLERRDKPTF